uniref:Ubiquitin-like protease family profile domain-containing protein n=1 Tax=Brassica oleracea var. oleracea TaxID=109376 RepID=A0A0D3CGQ6_BRAOL
MKGALMEALKDYLSKASSSPGDDYVFLERHTGFLGARVSGASIPLRPFSSAAAYHKTHAREIIDGVIDDLNQQHNPARADDLVRCPSSRRNRNQATPDSQGVDKGNPPPRRWFAHLLQTRVRLHLLLLPRQSQPTRKPTLRYLPMMMNRMENQFNQTTEESYIPYNLLEMPSFSLGLSQEEVDEVLVNVKPVQFFMPEEQVDVDFVKTRKSKRSRNMPAGYEDFQYDPKVGMGYDINPNIGGMFSNLQEELSKKEIIDVSRTHAISPTEFSDRALKPQTIAPKIMDALMLFIGRQLPGDYEKVQIFDTTLPTSLVKNHSRYTRISVKDRPKFKSSGLYVESLISQQPERIYFPFNIDQQHWVGVFVDTKATTINVLDCYVAFKSDSLLKREFTVVANTMPYIVRVANGSDMQGSLKLYSLTRCKGVPQVSSTADSAVMYVLLIEAHAKNGSQGIRGITSRVLPEGAKKLAVNFYNDLSAA